MIAEPGPRAIYASNGWEIDLGSRELRSRGVPVAIGSRAFEILEILVRSAGELVDKTELMDRTWPGAVVEDNTLQYHVSAIRKALGPDRGLLKTISGRGYRLLGNWSVPDAVGPPTNLPHPASDLIGRRAEVEKITRLVGARRLTTLTGTGGIGKTRLALAVASRLQRQFPDGVWLAELSPLSDPGLVPATLAAAVGLQLGGELSAQRVAQAIAARRLLVVLDTCEHVIGAAALLAEAVLQAGSEASILATSREPLLAESEQLYRVPPLAVPAEGADNPLDYGAVKLFVERARAAGLDLAPDAGSAPTIATICRRLDGIPLALEMAAAHVAALGVEEVARGLDDRFWLPTGGKRKALPRHQTLRATLDWSHNLLDDGERVLLRRLAVFSGPFSLEAVGAVVAGAGIAPRDVVDGLSSLVAKSLVVAEVDAALPHYRLLDTTRAYALEKLAASGERERLARRHAEYCREMFSRAEAELDQRPTADWVGDYGRQIDNLRAALGWAFSPGGDPQLGAALTAAAVPLWMHFSLLEECRTNVERALAANARGAGDERLEMRLDAALGVPLLYASDTTLAAIGAAWTRTLEIAERLGDSEYRLRGLWGSWVFEWGSGHYRAALALARRFHAAAADRPDPNDRLVGDRLIGITLQLLGDLAGARRHLEHALARYVPPVHRSYIIRFQNDQRAAAGAFLGRTLWLQGFPDRALRTIEASMADARASNHVITICHALIHGACPTALWFGDLAIAERYIRKLIGLATRHSLPLLRTMGLAFQGLLAIRRGDVAAGLPPLQPGLEVGDVYAAFRYFILTSDMAQALAGAGQIEKGLLALDAAIAGAERSDERWGSAELLRLRGELLLLRGEPGAEAAADDHFRQALELARGQGALSWELRAAMSRSRLLRDHGRAAAALEALRPVYDRFSEGFGSADLTAARALLQGLGG